MNRFTLLFSVASDKTAGVGRGGGYLSVFFMSVSIKSKLTNIAVSVCKLQVFQHAVVRSMSIKTNRCASTVLQ